jgi:hypothetical protein
MVTARHLFAVLSLVVGIGWLANVVARAPREGDRSPAAVDRTVLQRALLGRLQKQSTRFQGSVAETVALRQPARITGPAAPPPVQQLGRSIDDVVKGAPGTTLLAAQMRELDLLIETGLRTIEENLDDEMKGTVQEFRIWWRRAETKRKWANLETLSKAKGMPVGAYLPILYFNFLSEEAELKLQARGGGKDAADEISDEVFQRLSAWRTAAATVPGATAGFSYVAWAAYGGAAFVAWRFINAFADALEYTFVWKPTSEVFANVAEPLNGFFKSKVDRLFSVVRQEASAGIQGSIRKGTIAATAIQNNQLVDAEGVPFDFPSRRDAAGIGRWYEAFGKAIALQMSHNASLLNPEVANYVEEYMKDAGDFSTGYQGQVSAVFMGNRLAHENTLLNIWVPKLARYGIKEKDVINIVRLMEHTNALWISEGRNDARPMLTREARTQARLASWRKAGVPAAEIRNFELFVGDYITSMNMEVRGAVMRIQRLILDPQSGRGLLEETGLRQEAENLRLMTGFYNAIQRYPHQVQQALNRMGFGSIIQVEEILKYRGRGIEYYRDIQRELSEWASRKFCFEQAMADNMAGVSYTRRVLNWLRLRRRPTQPPLSVTRPQEN